MSYELIEIEQTSPEIQIIWMNRPKQLNALNVALMRELAAAAVALLDDTSTRVVVIAGRGKHFSAGADLKAPAPAQPTSVLQRRRAARFGSELMRALRNIPQITIAAVQGAALGGGCCIATACDFRIASRDAVCGYPEIDRGMNLQWQALPHCVQLIGPARAKRMVILGQHEDAETLYQWGFFDEVVEAEVLLTKALQVANQYAQKAPLAAQAIKQSINAISGALDQAIMHMDLDQWLLTASMEDYQEGVRAFFEKRTPHFRGN